MTEKVNTIPQTNKQSIIVQLQLDFNCAEKNEAYHRGLADGLKRAIRLISNESNIEEASLQELIKSL